MGSLRDAAEQLNSGLSGEEQSRDALIVLYAGITSFTESVSKILHPEAPDYSITALLIIAVAVVVKIVLGRYVKKIGERVNSDSLINSGEDATLDSVISAATLVAAGIFLATGISLEAWLGAVISIVIIKSGIEMLKDTISKLLGERADREQSKLRFDLVISFDEADREALYEKILKELQALYPDYTLEVALDTDFTVS